MWANLLHKFFLSGNIPSKKNSKRIITRGRKSPILLSSEDYLAWEKWAKYQILELKRDVKEPIKKARIDYTFIFENKRVKDLSNVLESINDLLVDMAIIVDDKWTCLSEMNVKGRLAEKDESCGVWITINEL